DDLSLAGAVAVAQGRQCADRRVQGGVTVDERGRRTERPPDGGTGQRHEPAHRLAQRIESGAVAIGPVLPEPRYRDEDDARLELAQTLVAEPHLLHDAGSEILQHDVGFRHERREDLLAALGAHVETEALLAAVIDREIDALSTHDGLGAAGFFTADFLDLDDLRAEIGEDHAAARAGLIPRQFQNPHAVQASAHRAPPSAKSPGGDKPPGSATILRPARARGKESNKCLMSSF